MDNCEDRLGRIEQALYHLADDYGQRIAILGQVHAENMYEEVRQIIEPTFAMKDNNYMTFSRTRLKEVIRFLEKRLEKFEHEEIQF